VGAVRLSQEQLERYGADGFLVLPGLFSSAEVEVLRAELPRLFAEDTPANIREKASGEVRTAMGLHTRSEAYARLCRDPRFVGPARQILGTDRLYVQQVKVNAKVAFSGETWQWHYDFATHHHEDGVPGPLALNLHLFLDDVTEHNGPLIFVRGSHAHGPARTALDTETTSYALWTVDNETVAQLAAGGGLVSATGTARRCWAPAATGISSSMPATATWDGPWRSARRGSWQTWLPGGSPISTLAASGLGRSRGDSEPGPATPGP
jgi:ectoine hydroxylase